MTQVPTLACSLGKQNILLTVEINCYARLTNAVWNAISAL